MRTRVVAVFAILIGAAPVMAEDVPPEVAASRALREAAATLAALPDTGSGITRDVGAIAVIEHDGSNYDKDLPDGTGNYGPRAAVALRFYETHPDDYDFIVVFTNFSFEKGEATAFHGVIRNEVSGIGLGPIDNGPLFGSLGRLKGFTDMADVGQYSALPYSTDPAAPGYGATLRVVMHEIAHQWLSRVRFHDAAGAASPALLGQNGSHWSALLDSDASVMYGSDWVRQPDGTYLAERTRERYSALDLYLMGLLDASKVPPLTLLVHPAADPAALPVEGAVLAAEPSTVTIEQIVAAEGPRAPGVLHSQKEFRAAFVFLTRPGVDPREEDLAAVDSVRRAASGLFFALTGGAAVLDTSLHRSAATVPGAVPDVDRALDWLLRQQSIDGRWEDRPGTGVRDTAAVVDALLRQGRSGLAVDRGVLWLQAAAITNADFLARRSEVVGALQPPAQRAALAEQLFALQNADGGLGAGPAYASDSLDTALALRALAALQHPADARVGRAVASLAEGRTASGAWPFVPGGPPSSITTAHVLSALHAWRAAVPEAAPLVASGLPALLERQNPDGGFGESPSTPYTTALALDVLFRLQAPEAVTAPALEWLGRTQLANGSWSDGRFDTALVASVLRASTTNLTVPMDSLVIEPPAVAEGDSVRITAQVRNSGRSPSPPSRAHLYDGDPASGTPVAEVSVGALAPGEEASVAFDLETTDRPGTRVLYVVADAAHEVAEAREDDNAASRSLLVKGLLPDLRIGAGDVSVSPEGPAEGEAAVVDVVVRNRGQRASGPSLLRVTVHRQTAAPVVLSASVPELPIGGVHPVAVSWTPAAAGPYTLTAFADSANALQEEDETNNVAALGVEVGGPVPEEADLTVRDVVLDPPVLRRLGDPVAVRARVANRGLTPATADVAVFDGEPEAGGVHVGQTTVTLPARSSTLVEVQWPPVQAGTRPIVVVADPEGLVPEADEMNNRAQATLVDPRNTVDLEVLLPDVTWSPERPRAGEVVEIQAIVRNRGTVPAIAIPVLLAHGEGADRRELMRQPVTLQPGESAAVPFAWRVGLAGSPLLLHVVVDPFGLLDELDEGNNEVTIALDVQPAGLPNWRVSGADVTVEPDPPVEGQPATIHIAVGNTGDAPAPATRVRVQVNQAPGGAVVAEAPVPELAAGASVVVTSTWPAVDARGLTGLAVVVDPDAEVEELDESDNAALRLLGAIRLPDLVITAAGVRLEPAFPRAGQAVAGHVTVRNLGQQPTPESEVRLFDGESGSGVVLSSAPVPALIPGGTAEVSVEWTASASGERLVTFLVDPDDAVTEFDEGNNSVRRSLVVQDSDLYVTAVYFSPNGDGVLDTTTLAYRTTAPVDVLVSDRNGQLVRALAQGAPAVASVEWDGRDDAGILVPDGTYTFTLRDASGTVHGRASVILDLNRSTLFEAAGTPYLRTQNLTCGLETYGPTTWFPGGDALLMLSRQGSAVADWGLSRLDLSGTFLPLHSDAWYSTAEFASEQAVSPTGQEALLLRSFELFVVDLVTGDRRSVASGVDSGEWSPDGRRIATGGRVLDAQGTVLAELPVGGGRLAWSPDGRFLAEVEPQGDEAKIVTASGEVVRTYSVDENAPTATSWRPDGTLLVRARTLTEDERYARAFVIDPGTDEATDVPWLRNAQIARVRWSADMARVLYGHEVIVESDIPSTTTYVARGDGTEPLLLVEQVFETVSFPADPVAALFRDFNRTGSCLGLRHDDLFTVTTTLNLTAEFAAERLPANIGIRLSGTVSDQYLEHYQIDYASATEPEVWHPIGTASDVPILDDALGSWVPPGPGTFLLRLQARDRAGNHATVVRSTSWDRVPAITNVTLSETLISPNGDGRKDSSSLRYLVVEPARGEVRIEGPIDGAIGEAALVRTLAVDPGPVGPVQIIWDGRDTAGQVVRDGRYRLLFNELPFEVEVDTTPPEVSWAYRNSRGALVKDLRGQPRTLTLADLGVVAWDNRLRSWRVGPYQGTVPLYEPERDEAGGVIYEDGVPRPRREGARLLPLSLTTADEWEVLNFATRTDETAIAEDHAGNVAQVAVVPVPEAIFVLGGVVVIPPGVADIVMNSPLEPGRVYDLPSGAERYAQVFYAETVTGSPAVTFEYRPESATEWIAVPPDVTGSLGSILFKNRALPAGVLHGRFVARQGSRTFVSEEFRFQACEEKLALGYETEDLEDGTIHLRATVRGNVSAPLRAAVLRITGSTGPDAPLSQQLPMRLAGDNLDVLLEVDVVIPKPECGANLRLEVLAEGVGGLQYRDEPGGCFRLKTALSSDGCLFQMFLYCGGNPDEVYVGGSFDDVPPLTSVILEGLPGKPPVAVQGAIRTGDRLSFLNFGLDVTGIPEARYLLSARLVTPGKPDELAARHPFLVDRTLPEGVEIVAPEEDGLVCAPSPPYTVRADERVGLSPQEIRRPDGTWTDFIVCDPCGMSMAGPGDATFAILRPQPGHGPHRLRLRACDPSGNSVVVERGLFIDNRGARVIWVNPPKPAFSPNGDGRQDTLLLEFAADVPSRVGVEIVHPQGGVVRSYGADVRADTPYSFAWDGLDEVGAVVPDGTYEIWVGPLGGCRPSPRQLVHYVVVDTVPPTAVITSPLEGASVGAAVDVVGTATDARFFGYELRFGLGESPATFTPIVARSGPVVNGLLGQWTPSVPPGVYTLRLVARDQADSESSAFVRVNVGARPLIERLAVTPLFSPNGDGRLDTAAIEYETLAEVRMVTEVRDGAGVPVRTLEQDVPRGVGSFVQAWTGDTGSGGTAPDGTYVAVVRAEPLAGGPGQQESAAIVLDRTPPAVVVANPAPGAIVPPERRVTATIDDRHLTVHRVRAIDATGESVLAEGHNPVTSAEIAVLSSLEEGPVRLFVEAEDAAGNVTQVEVPVTLDARPPEVSIASPAAGSVIDKVGARAIAGRLFDASPTEFVLSIGTGASPAFFDELARGTGRGETLTFGTWQDGTYPDGEYTLRVDATDAAGNRSEARSTVILDGSPPEARIASPIPEAALREPVPIAGWARDANLESWDIEAAPGAPGAAFQWTSLASGAEGVAGQPFTTWDPLPGEGPHVLRLTVRDRAGHAATAEVAVTVDRGPPGAPLTLTARVIPAATGLPDVRLDWTPPAEVDVVGYRVRRDSVPLTALTPGVSFADHLVPSGAHLYTVTALDRAGNESAPASATVRVEVDAPLVALLSPRHGASVGSPVEVLGTATDRNDFSEYRLSVGAGEDPSSFSLIRRGTAPVVVGALGTWFPTTEGPHVLSLEAVDVAGNTARVTALVTVDLQAPAAPVLVAVDNVPDPGSVTATWQAVEDPGLAGYLVYRNGRVANATGLLIGDVAAFLLPGPAYTDSNLRDGEHCYHVVAADRAGNRSPPSNSLCRSLDNYVPSARIVQPLNGTRFEFPVRLLAESVDGDIASVQFELRPGSAGPWQALGPPDPSVPFEAVLDPVGFTPGPYQVRAVARDTGGRTDAAPQSITLVYGDTTPPPPPQGLAAIVDGHRVQLTWPPSTAADVAGYRVYVDNSFRNAFPIVAAQYTDVIDLGRWFYRVTAIDGDGNESLPSAGVEAHVYALSLDLPPYPVTLAATAKLTGGGAPEDATIDVFREGEATPRGSAPALPDGRFQATGVPLEAGPSFLRAIGRQGPHRSVPSDYVLLIRNEPPTPVTSLQATAAGLSVAVAWDASADPEVPGYVVERNGADLTPAEPVSPSSVFGTASEDDPENAVDGDLETLWYPDGTPAFLGLAFDAPVLVDRVHVSFAQWDGPAPLAEYRIAAVWEGQLVTLVSVTGNAEAARVHHLPYPFLTSGVRLLIDSESSVGVSEVAVHAIPVIPVGEPGFDDPSVPDGRYTYGVAAIDRYGARSSVESAQVDVGDVVGPAPPAGLAATVTGSTVFLEWQANTEPDVAAYVVVRGGTRVATVGGTTWPDVGVPNGTYAYTLIAVDAVGNESLPSSPAEAAVSVMPPVAPVLSGVVAASGDVDLSWDHPGAAAFAILRSEVSGGPYDEIQRVPDVRAYRDGEARRGRRQHYVVRAYDLAGNASPLSNEVALTPVRTEPPGPPVLLLPTTAGRPLTTSRTRVPVGGRAEPRSVVAITGNGRLVGSAVASSAEFETIGAGLVPANAESVSISPDGSAVAFTVYDDEGYRSQWREVASGHSHDLVAPEEGDLLPGRFSPDGRRLLATLWSGSGVRLYAVDLPSGQATLVETDAYEAVWSPDGETLAVLGVQSGADATWLLDLSSGTRTVLGGAPYYLRFSPDGALIAGVEWVSAANRQEAVVYDRSGALVHRADDAAWEAPPAWSPDGTQVAYTSESDGLRARRLDTTTGEVADLTTGAQAEFGAQWDPAGEWLTFSRFTAGSPQDLIARRLASGEERVVAQRPNLWDVPDPPPVHEWLAGGRLAVSTTEPVVVVAAPGDFQAEGVPLDPGLNELVGRAIDVESLTAGLPSLPVHVTVPDDAFADLSVTAAGMSVYPGVPLPGSPATVSARVRNAGGAEATDVAVLLEVLDAAGSLRLSRTVTMAHIAAGASTVASAAWTPDHAGTFLFRVRVDPEGRIHEAREDDNEASRDVYVAAAATVVMEAETDAAEYAGGAPVSLRVRLRNGGPALAGVLRTGLETTTGAPVADVDARSVSLAYAQSLDLTIPWNTGTIEAGDYVLAVRLDGGGRAPVPLRILSDLAVRARVVPDRATVLEGDPIAFALRVENLGTNERLDGAAARLVVRPQGVATPAFETTLPLGAILPGGLWEGTATWPSAAVPGPHAVDVSIERATAPMAAAAAGFRVEPRVASVSGTLDLDRSQVLAGDSVEARIEIINTGLDPLSDVPVRVEIVSGADGLVLAAAAAAVSLAAGETVEVALPISTTGVPFGRHLVFLRGGTPAATLARALLHVRAPVTAPSIDSPTDGARVASDHPVLRVNNASTPDGVPLAYEFQLFRDAALTQAVRGVAGLPEAPGRTGWTVEVTLGEDQTYYWRARATDGFSSSPWTAVASFTVDVVNVVPVAPVPESPIDVRVASREPLLTVRNGDDPELEPLTYEFRVGTDPELSSVIASASGIAEGPAFTSWRVPVGLDENGTYYWSARAHDPVQPSVWTLPVRFVVDTVDEPPSAPLLLRPEPGGRVATLTPELAAEPAVDPEGAPVTHVFEIDRVPTFDSPALQVSEAVSASGGVAAWRPPAALLDDADHYWRVRGSDGVHFGPWAQGAFFVSVTNDPPSTPVPLAPADGGVVATRTPALRVRNAVDPDRDLLRYAFEVRDAAGAVVAASVVPEEPSETEWTVEPALQEDEDYTWAARSSDGALSSDWSAPSRFRVNQTLEPPTAPVPVSPPGGATITDTLRPTLVVDNAVSPEALPLTYEFEAYAVAADGGRTLVASAAGVPEAEPRTAWAITADLGDGLHTWRARAFDGTRQGPWSASSEFTIALDQPPAPPTGLAAQPGDGEVRLTWNANQEPDVVGYRVHRGTTPGGPYAPVGEPTAPSFVDGGLTNGTTYSYVVTARDDRFESAPSVEAAATPRAGRLEAEVWFKPDRVAGECLVDCARDRCGPGGTAAGCPTWLVAYIELPAGTPVTSIVVSSVRLGGSVVPDPGYRSITDSDHDGLPELKLRFRFSAVRELVAVGVSALRVQGLAGTAEFEGTGTLVVEGPEVGLRIAPRTLSTNHGSDVEARLSFEGCLHGGDIDPASLRLNGVVPIKRVVSTPGSDLIVKFSRPDVFAVLPAGDHVEVRVTGTVHGLPFVATDFIRVNK